MHGGARVSVVFSVQVIQVTTRGRVDAVKVVSQYSIPIENSRGDGASDLRTLYSSSFEHLDPPSLRIHERAFTAVTRDVGEAQWQSGTHWRGPGAAAASSEAWGRS